VGREKLVIKPGVASEDRFVNFVDLALASVA
jgi:hypothetical protein